MTCWSEQRAIVCALIVAWGPIELVAQADRTADTMRMGELKREAEGHFQQWEMDSVAQCAVGMLSIADDLLRRATELSDPDRERSARRWKAVGLVLLGRSGSGEDPISQLVAARQLFEGLHDNRALADVEAAIGEQYDRNGAYAVALLRYRSARAMYQANGDAIAAAGMTNSMGVVHRKMGEYGAAIELHLEAMPILEGTGDAALLAWQNIVIGAVYRSMREWPIARSYFSVARDKYASISDHAGSAMAYNDLGSAFQGEGLMDSALYWHSRAATLRRNSGDHNGSGDSYSYIAAIHFSCGEVQEALASYQEALTAYGKVNNVVAIAQVHESISRIKEFRGDDKGALVQLRNALAALRSTDRNRERTKIHYGLGRILAESGRERDGVAEFRTGLEIARSLDDTEAMMSGYRALSAVYMKLGDDRNAFVAHREYLSARDPGPAMADGAKVMQLMMRHEIEKARMMTAAMDVLEGNEKTVALRSQKQQTYVFIAGGSLFAVLAVGLYGRIRYTAQMRRSLRLQRRSLKRAKRMAEHGERYKERFLANMSHEIRTPMNAIMGMSAIMRRNEHLPEQKDYLDAITHNSEKLLKVLNGILDLSKLDASRLELEALPMDPRDLVQDVVLEMRGSAERKNIRLYSEVSTTVPAAVHGDAVRFRQIVSGLCDNAIKFTESGSVHIAVSAEDHGENAIWINLAVHDSGIGIPSDRIAGIFEDFNKVYSDGKRKYGGSGLGLAISKRLTELHGGTLSVESTVGAGSVFTVRLPYTIAGSTQREPEVRPALRDLRVLLADDNDFNIMVAKDELMCAIPGVRVDVAVTGREAVELFQANKYDIILMDVQMPEMNGYDATRAIRVLEVSEKRTPILAMSANVMHSEMDKCLEAGMDGHVPKPFKQEELMHALYGAIEPGYRS